MAVKGSIRGRDYSLESTNASFRMADVTAVNFDAQVTLLNNIQAAVQGVSLIDFEGKSMYAVDVPAEQDQPVSPYAQREAKWLVSYTDTASNAGSIEIGGPDLTLLDANGQDMNMSDAAAIALVSALELGVLSKAGLAITVTRIIHVGRNN